MSASPPSERKSSSPPPPLQIFGQPHGRTEVIQGPMFSGKTTELIRRLQTFKRFLRIGFIKHKRETRYTGMDMPNVAVLPSPTAGSESGRSITTTEVTLKRTTSDDAITHSMQSWTAQHAVAELFEIDSSLLLNYDLIAIDEGQFFPDLVAFCETWANQGKTIMVAGLSGTFERKPFPNMAELVATAEETTNLYAVCEYCRARAPFSKRLTASKEIELIGGKETYVAVCRACWNTPVMAPRPPTCTPPPPLLPSSSPTNVVPRPISTANCYTDVDGVVLV